MMHTISQWFDPQAQVVFTFCHDKTNCCVVQELLCSDCQGRIEPFRFRKLLQVQLPHVFCKLQCYVAFEAAFSCCGNAVSVHGSVFTRWTTNIEPSNELSALLDRSPADVRGVKFSGSPGMGLGTAVQTPDGCSCTDLSHCEGRVCTVFRRCLNRHLSWHLSWH